MQPIPAQRDQPTLRRADFFRQAAAADHARALLRDGLRPRPMADGIPARHAVFHFTGVRVEGGGFEPGEDHVGELQTEAQQWVPLWVWIVCHVHTVHRVAQPEASALPEERLGRDHVRKVRDSWLLELEDHADLRDAVTTSWGLDGYKGARALLPPEGPEARPGSRWLHLLRR